MQNFEYHTEGNVSMKEYSSKSREGAKFSIAKKVTIIFSAVLLAVVCIVSAMYYFQSSKGIIDSENSNMKYVAGGNAQSAANKITVYENAAKYTAAKQEVISMDWDKQKPILVEDAKNAGFYKMGVATPDGKAKYSNGSTTDISDRDYFKEAMNGTANISDPLVSTADKKLVVVIAVPIRNAHGNVAGVLTATADGQFISDIAAKLKISKNSSAVIFNNSGTIIGSADSKKVSEKYNIITAAQTDTSMKEKAQVFENALKASDIQNYTYKYTGKTKYLTVSPISGTSWYLGIETDKNDILQSLKNIKQIVVLSIILTLIVAAISMVLFSKLLKRPLEQTAYMLDELSNGNLEVKNNNVKFNDELGMMVRSVNKLTESLRHDVRDNLEKIAAGDMSTKITVKSDKDIISISMSKASKNIKALVEDINYVAGEATKGNLKERIDADKFQGEFKNAAVGFNNTLDSITEPLNLGLSQLKKIATGAGSEEIENSFSGTYYEFIETTNAVRESLFNMLSESRKVTEKAKKGDLEYRADTSKLKGNYIGIVAGINEVLDVVSTPIAESGEVLKKLAVNDYTKKVEGNYEGSFKDLTDHINAVQKNLVETQDLFEKIAAGDASLVEKVKSVKKKSENDHLIPAAVKMINSVASIVSITEKFVENTENGNLEARADVSKFEGSYQNIVKGLTKTLETIAEPIMEASDVLREIESGDLTTEMTGEYKGDFLIIKNSINNTISTFNKTLGSFNNATNQVAAGAEQVSQTSMTLSQGATEQASSVQELTASLTEVSAQTQDNANNAIEANKLAESAKNNAVGGNEHMKVMLKSMDDINASSNNISKIIKTIDDIAFQTNILALNAAVEAARAGQHGKGFTVVAEEVRNLATKSANAAAETAELIKNSISMVNEGTEIAKGTAGALEKIVDDISKTAGLVSGIASASSEQSAAIEQINQGIEQVSQVIQANSATSEESAAASEELSSQAELLKEEVEKFKLKKPEAEKIDYNSLSPDIIKNLEQMFEKEGKTEETAVPEKEKKPERKLKQVNGNKIIDIKKSKY